MLYDNLQRICALPQTDLDFIFWAYAQLRISHGDHSYTPSCGVPQGGILSPILFDFAMFFCMSEIEDKIKLLFNALPNIPQIIPQPFRSEDNSAWADDLATIFECQSNNFKIIIKTILRPLITVSLSWGLKINWNKSALLEFASLRRLYSDYSDAINNHIDLTFNLAPYDQPPDLIRVPCVTSYKYLGIYIDRRLSGLAHLDFLKKKCNFLANSLISIRKASKSVRFCHNTWTTFVGPLLDYSMTFRAYISPQTLNKNLTLSHDSAT